MHVIRAYVTCPSSSSTISIPQSMTICLLLMAPPESMTCSHETPAFTIGSFEFNSRSAMEDHPDRPGRVIPNNDGRGTSYITDHCGI